MTTESIGEARAALRISMANLFKAPTVGDLDSRLNQLADARK